MVKDIVVDVVFVSVHRFEQVNNVVRLYDATTTPELEDTGEIDLPFLLTIGLLDDVQALDEGCQEACIDSTLEVGDEACPLLSRQLWFGRLEATVKTLLHLFAPSCISRRKPEKMGRVDSRAGHM